jgi:LPXTG-site transpeptidase (sortase) family protein
LTGTAFPTQAGRTLLAGHVVDAQGAPSVFADLKTLHWGDEFVIYANGLKYVYQVQSNERIKADNMDIYKSSAYDEVSLITCQGYNETTGEYDWRIAVTGVLIRLEK